AAAWRCRNARISGSSGIASSEEGAEYSIRPAIAPRLREERGAGLPERPERDRAGGQLGHDFEPAPAELPHDRRRGSSPFDEDPLDRDVREDGRDEAGGVSREREGGGAALLERLDGSGGVGYSEHRHAMLLEVGDETTARVRAAPDDKESRAARSERDRTPAR